MTVTLEQHMGSDLDIVNNARASLDRKSDWEKYWWCENCNADWQVDPCTRNTHTGWPRTRLCKADEGLLRSLARNRHGTPFEAVVFRFHIETNIRVAREWQRHRIGSFNEMSTRYMKMDDADTSWCYIPEGQAVRRNAGKIMSYEMDEITEPETITRIKDLMRLSYADAILTYNALLMEGVSREVAAYVLPLGFRTAFYWTVNLRSIFNFLNLRNAPSALIDTTPVHTTQG